MEFNSSVSTTPPSKTEPAIVQQGRRKKGRGSCNFSDCPFKRCSGSTMKRTYRDIDDRIWKHDLFRSPRPRTYRPRFRDRRVGWRARKERVFRVLRTVEVNWPLRLLWGRQINKHLTRTRHQRAILAILRGRFAREKKVLMSKKNLPCAARPAENWFPGCPPLPIQQSSSYTLEGGSIDETCLTFFASWFSNTRFVKTAGNFPLHFDVPVLRRELFRLTHCWARAAGCSVHCGSCSLRWRQQPRCQWSLTVGRSWGRCGEAFYTLSKEECLV